jgi:hypothetical protein
VFFHGTKFDKFSKVWAVLHAYGWTDRQTDIMKLIGQFDFFALNNINIIHCFSFRFPTRKRPYDTHCIGGWNEHLRQSGASSVAGLSVMYVKHIISECVSDTVYQWHEIQFQEACCWANPACTHNMHGLMFSLHL